MARHTKDAVAPKHAAAKIPSRTDGVSNAMGFAEASRILPFSYQHRTAIPGGSFQALSSPGGKDSPVQGSGIDHLMIEDPQTRADGGRNQMSLCNPDVELNTVVKPGSRDLVAKAANGFGRREQGNEKGRQKSSRGSRKSTSRALLPPPQVPRTDPLRTRQNEERRQECWEDGVQKPSKKRHWNDFAHHELSRTTPEKNDDAAYLPGKKRKPVEAVTVISSDDEPLQASPPAGVGRPGGSRWPWLQDPSLQTRVDNSSSADDVHRLVATQSDPGPPLPASSTSGIPDTEPSLCPEQAALVGLILSGRNVFYTGSAGCGKSTVLKAFVKRLKEHPDWPKKVNIIAPTGRAALDIGGSTFWTYAGWTPDHMKKPLKDLRKAAHAKFVKKRLRETDVLVIDEVSMMENHHFERLNHVMKEARGNERAFGGVQLVVTGDFCQLPPVKPFQYCLDCGTELKQDVSGDVHRCNAHGTFRDSDKWAFLSRAWEECHFEHVNLTTIHRQSDEVFIAMLQKCRLGIPLSPEDEDLLINHDSQTGNAVRLFSTREEVRVVNKTAFDRLPTQKRAYKCYDDFRCHSTHLESKGRRNEYDDTLIALRDHRFDPCIELKQGMQVVLLVNLDIGAGLVNGSQGVITGFEIVTPAKLPKAKEDGKAAPSHSSVPLLTGEHAEVRAANIRTFMEGVVAKELPIVLFQNRVTQTIFPDCRVSELGDQKPYSLLSRTQIPLIAGWAMTVHKSQGMTLNRVVVNLSKSFEEGQLYVALSRARSLEGLKVEALGQQPGRNEQVRQFLWNKFGIR